MAALIVQLADAIVADLNGQTFTKSLTAVRLYDPEIDLAELVGGRLAVVPFDDGQAKTTTRGLDRCDLVIHVAVQAKVESAPGSDTDELDEWMAFADEVKNFLAHHAPGGTDAVVATVQRKPVYSLEHLRKLRAFMSVISVSLAIGVRRE
jgi:hypothetical protein